MGRSRRYRRDEEESDTEDEEARSAHYYTLMPDTKSPFSCCCICYRYLLDMCLVLALSPFIINCCVEAGIYLVNFKWNELTWGRAILGLIVVSLWSSVAIFGILCCISVMRKGVFTRRLRQRKKDDVEAQRLRHPPSKRNDDDTYADSTVAGDETVADESTMA